MVAKLHQVLVQDPWASLLVEEMYPVIQKNDYNCTLFYSLCLKVTLNFTSSTGAIPTVNWIYGPTSISIFFLSIAVLWNFYQCYVFQHLKNIMVISLFRYDRKVTIFTSRPITAICFSINDVKNIFIQLFSLQNCKSNYFKTQLKLYSYLKITQIL